MVYRLRRRKNIRYGTTVVRACPCASTTRALCAACTFTEYLAVACRHPGDMFWQYTESQFVKMVRGTLVLHHVDQGNKFTCNSVHAGRATQLAADGVPIPVVLQQVEWTNV